MNRKRIWHSLVYNGGQIYMIGGFDGVKRLKQCEKLDLNEILNNGQPNIESISSMNEERSNFGCCLVNQKMVYVAGGRMNQNYTDSVECYDIRMDKW